MALVGLTLRQWFGIRILYAALRFAGARLCGKLTDSIRERLLGTSRQRFRKALADAIALSLYQIPLYIVSALVMGARFRQVAITSSIYLVENALLGWLYGVILDWGTGELFEETTRQHREQMLRRSAAHWGA